MTVRSALVPTLLTHPTTACPRCDGPRIVLLGSADDREFDWRECEECGHLWALPPGWTPHRP